jgi:Lon protease-like protein
MAVDLSRLPIFPLPGALLFPHAVLPLHVFEPRYRRMLADCMSGDRTLGIACLHHGGDTPEPHDDFVLPGGMPIERPLVRRLVGVGEIVAHEPMADGRSNILLRGLGRARIDEELPPDGERPYRMVRAVWVRDRVIDDLRERTARDTMAALGHRLAERLPEGGDTLRALIGTQEDAGALADLLAAALVTLPQERLRVFEDLDIAARAEGVVAAIGLALATLGNDDAPN